VKPETARDVRRLVPRRRRARGRPDPKGGPVTTAAGWPPGALERPDVALESTAFEAGDPRAEGVSRIQPSSQPHRTAGWNLDPGEGFDPAEFADFLEADDSPMPADPAFKERLRQRLWGMVRENANTSTPPASPRAGARPRRPLPDPKPKLPR